MIHLADTIQIEPTLKNQSFEIKKYAFPVELVLILLFLFCSACGSSPGQPSAMEGQQPAIENNESAYTSGTTPEINAEPATCGRESYPVYQDVENQKIVNSDIETGSAQVILHFHNLGQSTIDAFLARTNGVLEVDSQWPDWGAVSITVNENGLKQLSQDCAVRVIEANKRELPQ